MGLGEETFGKTDELVLMHTAKSFWRTWPERESTIGSAANCPIVKGLSAGTDRERAGSRGSGVPWAQESLVQAVESVTGN